MTYMCVKFARFKFIIVGCGSFSMIIFIIYIVLPEFVLVFDMLPL